MGIGPEEAGRLAWWEYQAMLAEWNEPHNTDKAPDFERLKSMMVARGSC